VKQKNNEFHKFSDHTHHYSSTVKTVFCCLLSQNIVTDVSFSTLLFFLSIEKNSLSILQITSQHKRVCMEKAYSKQRWRTIRERESERASKRVRKRERDLVVSGFVSRARACLFIFASGLRTHYTRWIFSLAFFFHRQQQAKKKQKKKKKKLKI
jgi:hypothetical protein